MEQAEFAGRSGVVRESSGIHRILDFLGRLFLGIDADEAPKARHRTETKWWDREDVAGDEFAAAESRPMVLGHQAELFDAEGRSMVLGGESGATTAAGTGATAAVRPSARLVPQTVVSVQVRGLGKGRSRAVAVTRPAAMGMAQAAVTPRVRTAVGQKGEIGRHLVMSLSISSGKEESRRFSVPRRVLRPHFQLFEGSAAVIEDENGGYRLGRQDLRTQRGQVWFV